MRKASEKGFVLVPAVWLAGLIGIALSIFLTDIRVDTRVSANLVENTKAEFLADGVVRLVAFRLATEDGTLLGDARTHRKCRLNEEHTVLIRVQDQSGLVDLNAASAGTLRELASQLGFDLASAQSVADKIIDFRDKDDSPLPSGAEKRDYEAAGLEQNPKNGPFEHISELDQVLGMSEQFLKLLARSVTIYSSQDGIDAAVAPEHLKTSKGSKFPLILSQQQSFAIDALVAKKDGTGFHRRAIIRVLHRPEKPFTIMEWEIGGPEEAMKLRGASAEECPFGMENAAIQ